MFKSIHHIYYPSIGPSIPDIGGYKVYHYRIHDSEFVEEWYAYCKQTLFYTEVRPGAIIRCYETKGKDVAFNLCLYHKYMQDTYSWYELEKEIGYNIDHTPGYVYYAKNIQEYLERYDKLKAFW